MVEALLLTGAGRLGGARQPRTIFALPGQHAVGPSAILEKLLEGGIVDSLPAGGCSCGAGGLALLGQGEARLWEPLGLPQDVLIEARLAGALLQELDDPEWG